MVHFNNISHLTHMVYMDTILNFVVKAFKPIKPHIANQTLGVKGTNIQDHFTDTTFEWIGITLIGYLIMFKVRCILHCRFDMSFIDWWVITLSFLWALKPRAALHLQSREFSNINFDLNTIPKCTLCSQWSVALLKKPDAQMIPQLSICNIYFILHM